MHIKYYLSFIFLIMHSLFAETYPLAQKPFLDTIGTSDKFERGTFLIVIPEDSYEQYLSIESIGDYIGFKKTQGYDVEVWNFENIGSANNLRDSLKVYYDENNLLEYVLLIGDYDPDTQILNPVIDSFTISSYNEIQDDVTDHPFTYFNGGPETEDGLHPNYFIGRWSFSSNSDLVTIISRTVKYITMKDVNDVSYVERALIVAGSYKTEGSISLETLPHKWPVSPLWTSRWLTEKLSQYGYAKIDTAFFHSGNMQSTNPIIENSWNDGVGVINYRGWGNAQGWVKPQFLISPNVGNLTATNLLPIVFSFVCNTGDFGNDVEPSFGEALIRAGSFNSPKGAVAMIGPSDLDTDTRFNNVMCGALWDGLLEGRTPELAQALHAAKQAVGKEFEGVVETGAGGPQNIPVFYHHVYGILGDPSIPVWLKTPSNIIALDDANVIFEDSLKLTEKFISIRLQDESGELLQDVVGALLYNGDLIGKGLSTFDGYLDIDFSGISTINIGAKMELYLNKAQFYQKKIAITLAEILNNTPPEHNYGEEIVESTDLYKVEEIPYNWIEINPASPDKVYNGENLHLTDDTIAKDEPIGFDFTYYDSTYSTINICSNGWAAFEKSDIPWFWNFSIPFPIGPSAMLAVFMDDLDDNGKEPFIDNNSNHLYDAEIDEFITDCGTANNPVDPYICHDYNQNGIYDAGEPFNVFKWVDAINHRFIVQWDELSNAEDDENCETNTGCVKETFQMILYDPAYQSIEEQGNIVFQYKEIYDIDDGRIGKNGNLSTIGIESPDQNKGLQFLFRGTLWDGTILEDGDLDGKAIQFSANSLGFTEKNTFQPSKIQLIGAYPNPFNPITTIRYTLNELSRIDLTVHNLKGQEVLSLFKGIKSSGSYQVNWDASALSSGVYFITLSSSDIHLTQKVILLK